MYPLTLDRPTGPAPYVAHTRAVAAGASEPVSVGEAKAHLNVTHDEDDAYLSSLISAARAALEDAYDVALVPQTVTATYAGRGHAADLPVEPVRSVTTVTRTTSAGSSVAYGAASVRRVGPRLSLVGGSPLAYDGDDLVVVYEAGPVDGTDNDARHKQAVLVWAADLYENRVSFDTGSLAVIEMPGAVRALLPKRYHL